MRSKYISIFSQTQFTNVSATHHAKWPEIVVHCTYYSNSSWDNFRKGESRMSILNGRSCKYHCRSILLFHDVIYARKIMCVKLIISWLSVSNKYILFGCFFFQTFYTQGLSRQPKQKTFRNQFIKKTIQEKDTFQSLGPLKTMSLWNYTFLNNLV